MERNPGLEDSIGAFRKHYIRSLLLFYSLRFLFQTIKQNKFESDKESALT